MVEGREVRRGEELFVTLKYAKVRERMDEVGIPYQEIITGEPKVDLREGRGKRDSWDAKENGTSSRKNIEYMRNEERKL